MTSAKAIGALCVVSSLMNIVSGTGVCGLAGSSALVATSGTQGMPIEALLNDVVSVALIPTLVTYNRTSNGPTTTRCRMIGTAAKSAGMAYLTSVNL